MKYSYNKLVKVGNIDKCFCVERMFVVIYVYIMFGIIYKYTVFSNEVSSVKLQKNYACFGEKDGELYKFNLQ